MLVPLLRALRASRPDAEITLVARAQFLPLLKDWNVTDRLLPLPPRGAGDFLHFWRLRGEFPDLRLHLIGPLQTNKVKDAVAHFDVIETVDRPRLAEALAREMERTGRRLPCLIEVNTGEEAQKAGIFPAVADNFIEDCRGRLGLLIEGLMCVPPHDEEPSPHFALLREIARRHDLKVLSMGMSADFETAIRFGATYVRVGTAVFGARRVSFAHA